MLWKPRTVVSATSTPLVMTQVGSIVEQAKWSWEQLGEAWSWSTKTNGDLGHLNY